MWVESFVIYCPYLLAINDFLPDFQWHSNSLPLAPFAVEMQDIRQPTRALTRPRYYDNDFPSNPADYLAANRDLTQRYLQLIDISWIRAHLPRITREQILPHTDPRRTQHSPPIASIAAPNSSRTPGRRVRRPQRYVRYSRNRIRQESQWLRDLKARRHRIWAKCNRPPTRRPWNSEKQIGEFVQADAWERFSRDTYLLGQRRALPDCSGGNHWPNRWGYCMANNFPGILRTQGLLDEIFAVVLCE